MFDYAVIGGGIIGLSTAWQLKQRSPDKRIVLLEKEERCASHQTGRNSGVIHAGIYYQPGSLKARLCRAGNDATIEFCRAYNLPFEQCGKLVVATNKEECQRLESLFARAQENNIAVQWVRQSELEAQEPNVAGCAAMAVRSTAIVDYQQVAGQMRALYQELGGEVLYNEEVVAFREQRDHVVLSSASTDTQARYVIACAGLLADRVAKMAGLPLDFALVPFRGEYYRIDATKQDLVRQLIYPVPNPQLPFLGVHLTRTIDGGLTVGPNAVFACKREGYGKLDFSWRDTREVLAFRGFRTLARKHFRFGVGEFKNSWFKRGYLTEVQKYCPSLRLPDLKPHASGVRAQAVSAQGTLMNDFVIRTTKRSVHVCNAPSPAATAAIPIGHYIVQQVDTHFGGV